MMPETTKTRKPAYKPHVRILDGSLGLYTVQSERYTHLLYMVTVRCGGPVSCECTAGSFNRMCKHQAAVAHLMAYRANPQHIRVAGEVTRVTSAAGLMEAFGIGA